MTQILNLFDEDVRADGDTLGRSCDTLQDGDAEAAERLLAQYLRKSISVRDTMAREDRKESFYHGVLLGILSAKDGWDVRSNRKSGEGYADILAMIEITVSFNSPADFLNSSVSVSFPKFMKFSPYQRHYYAG